MEQYKIDRINELARKAKTEPLTPEETEERAALRREYIDGYKKSLERELDSTYLLRPDGTKEKLNKKKK